MVPSVMDSPICGMRTSVPGLVAAVGADSGCGGGMAASLRGGGLGGGGDGVFLRSAGAAAGCGRGGGGACFIDGADDGVDLDGGAFLDLDLAECAGGGRGDFGVDLVGGDFEERLVARDGVAGLLEPLGEGAFGDGFAHLGHDYFGRHSGILRSS